MFGRKRAKKDVVAFREIAFEPSDPNGRPARRPPATNGRGAPNGGARPAKRPPQRPAGAKPNGTKQGKPAPNRRPTEPKTTESSSETKAMPETPPPEPTANEHDASAPEATAGEESDEASKEAEMKARLEEVLAEMQKDREQMRKMHDEMNGMTGNMDSLRQLSEAISVRYNPFLDDKEDVKFGQGPVQDKKMPAGAEVVRPAGADSDAFVAEPLSAARARRPADDPEPAEAPLGTKPTHNHPADDAHAGSPSDAIVNRPPRPPAARSKPATDPKEIPSGPPIPLPAHLPPPPAPTPPPAPAPNPTPDPVPEAVPVVEDAAPAGPTTESEPLATPPTRPEPASRPQERPRAIAPAPDLGAVPSMWHPEVRPDARNTDMVLQWFSKLAAETDPRAVFLFLDHYYDLGWITRDMYAWMYDLALGFSKPRANAQWSTFKLTPDRLIPMHQVNLRFIDLLVRGPDCAAGATAEVRRMHQRIDKILGDR